MVAQESVRASGDTTATEVTQEEGLSIFKPVEDEVEKNVLTPRFARMRTDWQGPDADTIARIKRTVERQVQREFSDAYDIMFDIYALVREPEVDEDGEVVWEGNSPKWLKDSSGRFIEDWSQITVKERERYLYMITTRQFEWTQTAADAWGEAIFAKAKWEEAFANGFESLEGERPTIEARKARGNKLAAEDRYLAVYKSLYSRKAESLVRSLELLSQRLKDIHTS